MLSIAFNITGSDIILLFARPRNRLIFCKFSLWMGKYLAIKCLEIVRDHESWSRCQLKAMSHLSNFEKGFYYTTTDRNSRLQVWILNEELEASKGTLPVWEMVHYVDTEPPIWQLLCEKHRHMSQYWILDHVEAKPNGPRTTSRTPTMIILILVLQKKTRRR